MKTIQLSDAEVQALVQSLTSVLQKLTATNGIQMSIPEVAPGFDPMKGLHKHSSNVVTELRAIFGTNWIDCKDPRVKACKHKNMLHSLTGTLQILEERKAVELEWPVDRGIGKTMKRFRFLW
jgi:hypothetical protein